MEDKLINGIKAGLMGSLAKDLIAGVMEFFKLTPTYFSYGQYILFRKVESFMSHKIVGFGIELLYGLVIAVFYAHTKHIIKTNHPLLKGFGFGLLIWFFSRSLITITNAEPLIPHNFYIGPINALIGGIYGLVVSWTLEVNERKSNERMES